MSEVKNEEQNKTDERKEFICHMCKLYSRYVYYGTRPLERHFEKTISSKSTTKKEELILLEKAYVSDDPFSELKSNNFLILGAQCHVCAKMVCVGNDCSLFYYNKRFCVKCTSEIDEFPNEIKSELLKIIENSKNNSK